MQPSVEPTSIASAAWPVLLLGAYFFLGLVVYGMRRLLHGPFEDLEITSRGRTALIGFAPRHYFAWVMSPILRFLVKIDLPANAVTSLSVLVAFASGVALADGEFALGGWLYAFAGVCDFTDGRLARATGRSSPAGAALDSVLDRYAESAVFIGLAWYFRESWVLLPVLVALCGSHLVPYVRARGEGLGVRVEVGTMQRPERLVIIAATCAFSPIVEAHFAPGAAQPLHRLAVVGILILAATTPITALFRLAHVMNALDPTRRSPFAQPASVGGIARNAVAAVVATLADFAVMYLALRTLSAAPWLATLLGCLAGGVLNFLLNRVWTFESRAPAFGQAVRYAFVSGSNALLNAGGVGALMLLPGMNPLVAWTVARALTFLLWSYPLHRDYVYAEADAEAAPGVSTS